VCVLRVVLKAATHLVPKNRTAMDYLGMRQAGGCELSDCRQEGRHSERTSVTVGGALGVYLGVLHVHPGL
jgi:hypothetical protein